MLKIFIHVYPFSQMIWCLKVSKKNLMEIVKKLMVHMDKAEGTHYRDELLAKIVEISSQSNYQYITNFEWLASVW